MFDSMIPLSQMQSQQAGDGVQATIHPSLSQLQQDKVHSNVWPERKREDAGRAGRVGPAR